MKRKNSDKAVLKAFALDHESVAFKTTRIVHADCFKWLSKIPEGSVHAVVTDPPYGVKEYEHGELEKLHKNNNYGGIWRIPPAFDGNVRSPLPRFTALVSKERDAIDSFFYEWSKLVIRALRPGGHVFIASNAFLSQLVFSALVRGGLEFRGELIRLVRTLRGGDRPKNAEEEFPDVCSMARGCYEPWGILRKSMPGGMTVAACLREYGTGGLRRQRDGSPFNDVIHSERTPAVEREVADHPSLKPQSLLRQLVWASLPLGKGVLIDPFMGSGSTVAAAEAIGLHCVGIERYRDYYDVATRAIPQLSKTTVRDFASKDQQLTLI